MDLRDRSVEQKPESLIHESSSVGARPSPAAPFEQRPPSLIHESPLTPRVLEMRQLLNSAGMVFDGGGRGRPRSDRRAFAYQGLGILFDGQDARSNKISVRVSVERADEGRSVVTSREL